MQRLQRLALAAALWYLLAFIFIAISSIHYPYLLEWMEGQTMDVARRILEGKPLYVEPHIDYVPFIYPPLYYEAVAMMTKIVGVELFAARLVSVIANAATALILFRWVQRETASRQYAFISIGLFYATYMLSARWFDIARVDSLYVALLMGAAYLFIYGRSVFASLITGLLMALAFLTKQSVVMALVPLLLAGLWLKPAYAFRSILVFIGAAGAWVYFYNQTTDGWLNFYLFTLPAAHQLDAYYVMGFWLFDLFTPLAPLLIIAAMGWQDLWEKDKKKAMLYLALAAGFVGSAYAGRLHRFGSPNVLIPMHLVLAMWAGFALSRFREFPKKQTIIFALILLQFAMLVYNPLNAIPSDAMKEQNENFLARVKEFPDEVLIPELQFIQERAGKKSTIYGVAAVDVLQSSIDAQVKDALRQEMTEALSAHRYQAVITSNLIRLKSLEDFYQPNAEELPMDFVSGAVPQLLLRVYLPLDKSGAINNQSSDHRSVP